MGVHGCTPDVVTYTALISAYERGGQWQKALQAFHKMCLQGCKPDAIVYNAIIDTLWETGIIWAQSKALQLFLKAVQQGHFRQEQLVAGPRRPGPGGSGRVEVNLHAMTAGVAMVCLYCWLLELRCEGARRKGVGGGDIRCAQGRAACERCEHLHGSGGCTRRSQVSL